MTDQTVPRRAETPLDEIDLTDEAVSVADDRSEVGDAPLLEVNGVTVQYGSVIAVDAVSLDVAAGSVVGLIGPNGAGKTSLIDGITGFAAASGTVAIAGGRVDGMAPHVRLRRGMARTFQSLELYDDLSVEENVSVAAFAADPGSQEHAVRRSLALLDIAHLRDRIAGDLSKGERQLVSMARACAANPRILLLDEPAAGLDSTESRWLGDRIRAVAASGAGVLLIDHDIALVLAVCDHIYVLDFGVCIAHGDPDAIRRSPAVAEAYLGSLHEPEPTVDGA